MKKIISLCTIALYFNFSYSQELTVHDFKYLNKGIWELQKNGYEPRPDLKMILTYGAKEKNSNWYYMCHKVCKDSVYLGYVLTAKPSAASEVVFNLFFLDKYYEFIDKHNSDLINKVTFDSRSFLKRATTTELYKLNNKCN